MESILYSVVGFLLATGLLVTLHEWGHYCIGRLFDVKVLRFSMGFGKALWKKRRGADQTEWQIAAIPLGGYVQFLSERDESHPVPPEEKHRAFENKKPLQKIAIVAAGPLMNLFVAIILYSVVFSVGIEQERPRFMAPATTSILAQAGLHEAGEMISWDHTPIRSVQDFQWQWFKQMGHREGVTQWAIRTSSGHIQRLSIQRAALPNKDEFGEWLEAVGFQPYFPSIPPIVGELMTGYPAAQAGLKTGDRILEINGQPIHDWKAVVDRIQPQAGHTVTLVYQRGTQHHTASIVPLSVLDEHRHTVGRMGIAPQKIKLDRSEFHTLVRYPVVEAIQHAVYKTYELCAMTLISLWKMLTGSLSLNAISGPVTMAEVAGQSLQAGWIIYLNYLALISVSLGVMNLLPIPVLDGGHILYECIALLRGGRALSMKWLSWGQTVGIGLLGALMMLAFYNDWHHIVATLQH
jgi:regulator of sigma E protease